MHASIEELLNLRDGDATAPGVGAHVAACPQCGAELQRLRGLRVALTALPLTQPTPALWGRITQRANAHKSPLGPGLFVAGVGVAAAVMLLSVLVARLQQPVAPVPVATTQRPSPASKAGAAPNASAAPTAPATGNAAIAPGTPLDRDALIERSRALETALAAVSFEPHVVNAGTAATIATLEDHIAVVDYRLSMDVEDPLPPEQSRRLWQQRVDLMDSLVNVRYAQLQRVGY